MPIIQMEGKLTKKQAISIAEKSVPVINYLTPSTNTEDFKFLDLNLFGYDVIKNIGKPLVLISEYESSPGLWIFDDTESGIRFLLWSDGYKKHPWKGTSYEAIFTALKQVKMLNEAFNRLMEHIYYEPENL